MKSQTRAIETRAKPGRSKRTGTLGGRLRPARSLAPTPEVVILHRRKALIYQRLSTMEQKRTSIYSLERQDRLADLARTDGYADHMIHIEKRDLGISGTKGADARPGLAELIRAVEADEVESVYVVEVSRISRDQTLLDGIQFGELLRRRGVALITPHMRLNLGHPAHMRLYRYELDRAAEELRVQQFRLHGALAAKAGHGRYAGGSLPPGYVLDTDESLPDSAPNPGYQKFKPYPPHAEIIVLLFQEFIKPGMTCKRLAAWCRANRVVFPPLPPEQLEVAPNRQAFARSCPLPDGSYPIPRTRLASILRNPAYLGWFVWGGQVQSTGNHPALIEEEVFWAAQRKFKEHASPSPRRPLLLDGLVVCERHDPPRRFHSRSTVGREAYACCASGGESYCCVISAHILDRPVGEHVLARVSLGEVSQEVIEELRSRREGVRERSEGKKRERERLQGEIENLKANLALTRTPTQVQTLLRMVDDRVEALAATTQEPADASENFLARLDPDKVREFLDTLPERWEGLEVQSRNEILRLLLDRIEITRETVDEIVLAVHWAIGREECLQIRRWNAAAKFGRWSEGEDSLLRELYPRAPRTMILDRLPGRRWSAIQRRASALGIRRERKPVVNARSN